ncbi:sulfite exporter TauE/SafE family protein [Streptomyces inhibens]|uniref:Probable membrane transporter protein n=1 Tax=Streptomyces inhibens TaxID=2293571 RepID=A0A371PS26_STRIH|nr:sulfite exporter TauE/SafE family protein [Streptomyces inhibens]
MLIGLLLGALGGGGSVLAVPALVYLLGQSPHEATAGALVVVTVGAVTGLVCHARAGRVRWAAGSVFGALGTAGSYLGSRWSATLDPTVLMAAFAGLMLVVAAMLLLRGLRERRSTGTVRPLRDPTETAPLRDPTETEPLRDRSEADPLRDHPEADPVPDHAGTEPLPDHAGAAPTPDHAGTAPTPDHREAAPSPDHAGADSSRDHAGADSSRDDTGTDRLRDPMRPIPHPARIIATAFVVGLLTGFFGVGGGFVVVPALTLILGLEMPVAIGTSLLVILINSLTALGTRAGTSNLDWPLLAGFAAAAALGSHLGNRLTTRLRPQVLTTAFASLVTILAVTMAAAALPHLWSP